MELKSLRYALRVAESLSFRQAAASLSVKPSVVSRRIQSLESETGLTIFERTPSGVRVTAAGRRYLDQARLSLSTLDNAAIAASQIERGATGSLAIAFYPSLASGRLRALFAACHKQQPNIEMTFLELTSANQSVALRFGSVDAGFSAGRGDDIVGLESQQLWEERMYVAMQVDDALAQRRDLSWSDIRYLDFIVRGYDSGPASYAWLSVLISMGGVAPSIRQFNVSRESLIGLVGAGFGLTVVSEAAATMQFPGVVFRPISDENALMQVRLAWSSTNSNPALGPFLSRARRIARRSKWPIEPEALPSAQS